MNERGGWGHIVSCMSAYENTTYLLEAMNLSHVSAKPLLSDYVPPVV